MIGAGITYNQMVPNDLTSVDHWDDAWSGEIRLRLPSRWMISTRNLQNLLRGRVQPGDRLLEIGCAPGKLLSWAATELGAEVSGLDYSERGLSTTRRLFAALQLTADLRCEDLRRATFAAGSFDWVVSYGVIEHFDDPRDVVRVHVDLLKPGGTALMTVPNYRGVYGVLQRYFDAENLLSHNLDIMSCSALARLVPNDGGTGVRTYMAGRFSPWQLSLGKRWPSPVARGVSYLGNVFGLLQPFEMAALKPMFVLEVHRLDTR
jgi:2-polyprenyl-3-methyl-5-hydroxy-6-metoxy-1,4-benzoquinol methylase